MAYGMQSIFKPYVDSAANQYGVPADLLNALVNRESGYNAYSLSSSGAIGLTQLMPGTAQQLGVDPWNPQDNANGGAQYLSALKNQFGNWRDALRAYNVGPSAAKNDPNAGASYADSILMNAPSVSNLQTGLNPPNLANDFSQIGSVLSSSGIKSTLGAVSDTAGQILGLPPTNLSGSTSKGWLQQLQDWIVSTGMLYIGALLVIAALIWHGIGSLTGDNKLTTSALVAAA